MTSNEQLRTAVEKVVNYLYHDEEKHYEECLLTDPKDGEGHIFHSVKTLSDWLDEQQ